MIIGIEMNTTLINWIWRFLVSYAAVVTVRKRRDRKKEEEQERTRKYEAERERQLKKYDIYRED